MGNFSTFVYIWKSLYEDVKNTWPVILKTVTVFKNKESLRNCHNSEGCKETWQLNVMRYLRVGPGTEKGHQGQWEDIWTKYELLNNSSISVVSLIVTNAPNYLRH